MLNDEKTTILCLMNELHKFQNILLKEQTKHLKYEIIHNLTKFGLVVLS